MCGCATEVGSSVSSSSENGLVCSESVEGTVFLVVCGDTDALAGILINKRQAQRLVSSSSKIDCSYSRS